MPSDISPDQAFAALAQRIAPVAGESIPLSLAAGRILAAPIVADRDSPAADVSAMDGYAVRLTDLQHGQVLHVCGQSVPGHAPAIATSSESQDATVVRVFTGGIVPGRFDLVIKREETRESNDQIEVLHPPGRYRAGENIRRQGENAKAGSIILSSGTMLHAGAIAAAANFGAFRVAVARKLRVAILVTGDELRAIDDEVQPWQLRDSNGPTLHAMLSGCPWLDVASVDRIVDNRESLVDRLRSTIEQSDAVLLTGGVSMGDYDFVPDAITQCNAEILFHKLPIRPGKPILGAISPDGKPIVGLPGNPVSAAVGCRRFVMPLLGKQAGLTTTDRTPPRVMLEDAGDRTLPLHWFRLVTIDDAGKARLVPSQGSGDLVSLATSDGFIEQPPNSLGAGPWAFWNWNTNG
ncbi:MAG: molybdopterin molybdotransferase MoeA [Pirellulaceae bacterium]